VRIPVLKLVLLWALFLTSECALAQDSSSQKQIWPEVGAYYRFNEKFRLYGMISGTRSNSEYTDGTTGIYVDYFALPWLKGRKFADLHDTTLVYYFSFRVGYSYSNAPHNDKKKEINILETETNSNFLLPFDITLMDRNRLDWRWVNGAFQPVYRPRFKFIRNFKTDYLTFDTYLWGEYFFYLNDHSQDRLRLTVGSDIKVSDNVDFEVYYLYQFQHLQGVEPLHAIGLQIDLYFRSESYRRQIKSQKKEP
jgi:hypothetical protein